MSTREPLSQLKDEAQAAATRRITRVLDFARTWSGVQLLQILGGGVSVGGLLWVAFPWTVAAAGVVVIAAAVGYAIYCRKQLIEERTMRRRAVIRGLRLQQASLKSELALRDLAIGLAGGPQERRRLITSRAPGAQEVRQAATYAARRGQPAGSARPETTTKVPRKTTDVTAPRAWIRQDDGQARPIDVSPWLRRAKVLAAEIKELDAEIQLLAVPDSPELVAALDVSREAVRAAHEADRVARQRLRDGLTPSPEAAGMTLNISERMDGTRDVQEAEPERTPEQIADDAA